MQSKLYRWGGERQVLEVSFRGKTCRGTGSTIRTSAEGSSHAALPEKTKETVGKVRGKDSRGRGGRDTP